MSVPVVSVGVITYNHGEYIRQCLESIMMQKINFSIEVVIGEDCSTDNTRSVIREFEARYPDIIKPIYHDKNVGAARNAYEFCYAALKGKYIAICEGDDYWTDPYKLQKQVDFLEQHPECSFCYHKINMVDQNDQIIDKGQLSDEVTIHKAKDIFHLKITTLSVVFRNCIELTPQEMLNLKISDYVLFAILSNYGGAANLGFIGGHYRQHPGGIFTGLSTIQKFKYSLQLLRRMKQYTIFSRAQKAEIGKEIILRKKRYIKNSLRDKKLLNCLTILFI